MSEKKAIIIGAGPAGLTAAYELVHQTQIKPIIIEMSHDIGGIAKTENFIYATDQRKSAIVGSFDLNELNMNTVVGVAHMPGLDKILTQIPLVGKILTAGDEESLIKTYYAVKGPFDNPEITAVPLTSLGKKFMGLFQGVLQTSEEILTLPTR